MDTGAGDDGELEEAMGQFEAALEQNSNNIEVQGQGELLGEGALMNEGEL